jgi:hypothetical protein
MGVFDDRQPHFTRVFFVSSRLTPAGVVGGPLRLEGADNHLDKSKRSDARRRSAGEVGSGEGCAGEVCSADEEWPGEGCFLQGCPGEGGNEQGQGEGGVRPQDDSAPPGAGRIRGFGRACPARHACDRHRRHRPQGLRA